MMVGVQRFFLFTNQSEVDFGIGHLYVKMLNVPPWYERLLTTQGQLPQNEYDILKRMFADLAIVGLNPVYFSHRERERDWYFSCQQCDCHLVSRNVESDSFKNLVTCNFCGRNKWLQNFVPGFLSKRELPRIKIKLETRHKN
jgi:hypothetical protein